MKCRIELVTPEIAQDYLKANVSNRKTRREAVTALAEKMDSGKWKENGESIIFDTSGVLKDGQHRLMATVRSKHSWNAVIVTGVDPDVFDTIDTGLNRTLADVLYLEGFVKVGYIAPLIKASIIYNHTRQSSRKGRSAKRVYNSVGLKYAQKHKEVLYQYSTLANRAYKKSQYSVSLTFLGLVLHIICKLKSPLPEHEEFIKRIAGVVINEHTATAWMFNTFMKAKKEKVRLDDYWRLGVVIKVYNLYVQQGDPQIKYVKFNSDNGLPEVI